MEKICGIYMIENTVNNHIYIGSSNDITKRIRQHFNSLSKNYYDGTYFQNSFNVRGKDSFVGSVLITCHPDMLLFYEQQFIDAWKPDYNVSKIAGRPEWTDELRRKQSIVMQGNKRSKGRIYSEDTIKKMSMSAIGKKHSDEHNKNMGASKRGNQYWKGRKHSEYSKKKIADAFIGRELPDETKKKISASLMGNQNTKGYKQSEETKKKISNALIGNKYGKGNIGKRGYKHSEETKRKISASHTGKHYSTGNNYWKGKKHSEETKRKMSEARKAYWEARKS